MASDLIIHTTDATFASDVTQSELPVLVDFWAAWCGPCKAIAPVLDELAGMYEGKLKIAKMDVDENQAIPAQFGIRSIPTLILFKGGQVAATISGARPKRSWRLSLTSNWLRKSVKRYTFKTLLHAPICFQLAGAWSCLALHPVCMAGGFQTSSAKTELQVQQPGIRFGNRVFCCSCP